MSSGPSAYWSLNFSTKQLGTTLQQNVYDNAQRYPFEATGHPGLSVYGNGRGCNTVTGRFQIEEIATGPSGAVTSFTATFEHHCEGATAALRGCVHVGP